METRDADKLKEIVEALEDLGVRVKVEGMGRTGKVRSAGGEFQGYSGPAAADLRLTWE